MYLVPTIALLLISGFGFVAAVSVFVPTLIGITPGAAGDVVRMTGLELGAPCCPLSSSVVSVEIDSGLMTVESTSERDVFAQSLRCLAVEGRICPIGFASGTIPQIPANILLVKSIAVMGFNYGYYVGWSPHDARFEEAEKTFALMERIRGWCEAGLCRPHIDRTYRLEDAPKAMAALLDRSVTGRLAVVMD